MTYSLVANQLNEVILRLIGSSISVDQKFPSVINNNGFWEIGTKTTSYALRDVLYSDIYKELIKTSSYDVKLIDGGLLGFQYKFSNSGQLVKSRLTYFPSPTLPNYEEAEELYKKDLLYADVLEKRIVKFPVRFDYDPDNHVEPFHPKSHLTLGQYSNCRIPVSKPLMPSDFCLFIIRNFYHRVYISNKNIFEKRITKINNENTITKNEEALAYFNI